MVHQRLRTPVLLFVLAALLRFNQLTFGDLWAWLNGPFERPRIISASTEETILGNSGSALVVLPPQKRVAPTVEPFIRGV